MASIIRHKDGWRALVCKNGLRASKVFDSEEEAQLWVEMKERKLITKGSQFIPTEKLSMSQTKLLSSIPSRVLNAIANVPHDLNEVLDAAMPIGTAMGVYFLIKDKEVVYVGVSCGTIV